MTSTSNWPFLSTIPIWMSPEREKKEAHILEKQYSTVDKVYEWERLVWYYSSALVCLLSPDDPFSFSILKQGLSNRYLGSMVPSLGIQLIPAKKRYLFLNSLHQAHRWQFSHFCQYFIHIFGVTKMSQHVKKKELLSFLSSQTCFLAWVLTNDISCRKVNCFLWDQALFWSRSIKYKGSKLCADAQNITSLCFHISWNQLSRNLT